MQDTFIKVRGGCYLYNWELWELRLRIQIPVVTITDTPPNTNTMNTERPLSDVHKNILESIKPALLTGK